MITMMANYTCMNNHIMFKFTFNDNNIIIKNPLLCTKNEWNSMLNAIHNNNIYILNFDENQYIECLNDVIFHTHDHHVVIPLTYENKQMMIQCMKKLIMDEALRDYWHIL